MAFHPPQSHLQQRDRQFPKGVRLMRRSHDILSVDRFSVLVANFARASTELSVYLSHFWRLDRSKLKI
jgi:hypothetical protein